MKKECGWIALERVVYELWSALPELSDCRRNSYLDMVAVVKFGKLEIELQFFDS